MYRLSITYIVLYNIYIYICVHIYIYIWEREKEREREWEWKIERDLVDPRPTLAHSRGGSLIHPVFITSLLPTQRKGYQEPSGPKALMRQSVQYKTGWPKVKF